MLERFECDVARRRQHDDAISRPAAREEPAALDAGAPNLAIGDEVVGEAVPLKPAGRRFERRALRRRIRAAEVRQPRVATRGQRFVERVVEQHVVVGRARLQEGLHSRDVAVERAEVVPPGVLGAELDGGVELPAWPGLSHRRVGRAVIEDVVDAGDEEPVDVGADIRERRAEMLAEPRRRFRRDERPSGDVGRGCRPLEALNLGALGFRDVGRRVQVQQIGWGAVRLVAHLPPAVVRPLRPFDGERLEQRNPRWSRGSRRARGR